jgi:NAD(P)-dependent dehydrogenase (short-subunit alcohol dehydrogenase family)
VTQLDGRTVLITGAAGGIGSATARTVVAQGGRVVVHDRDMAALEDLVAELGTAAAPLAADLTDMAVVEALWHEAWAATGGIDVLVNNAGAYPPAPLDFTLDEWVGVWDLSLDPPSEGPGGPVPGGGASVRRPSRGRDHRQPRVPRRVPG